MLAIIQIVKTFVPQFAPVPRVKLENLSRKSRVFIEQLSLGSYSSPMLDLV
jgi:hypothetical protein